MSSDEVYQAGVDSFLTGNYRTPIHALARYTYSLSKQDRFKFAEGFLWAQSLFK